MEDAFFMVAIPSSLIAIQYITRCAACQALFLTGGCYNDRYYVERWSFLMKKVISTSGASAAIGPYSQAILAGDTLFASGQIAPDAGDVVKQAEKAFDGVEAILKEAGFAMSEIVKATVFLADMADFSRVNEVYARRMPEPFPARSAIQVAALPKGALVEIEVIAKKC